MSDPRDLCALCGDADPDWTTPGGANLYHRACVEQHLDYPDNNRQRRACANVLAYGHAYAVSAPPPTTEARP